MVYEEGVVWWRAVALWEDVRGHDRDGEELNILRRGARSEERVEGMLTVERMGWKRW